VLMSSTRGTRLFLANRFDVDAMIRLGTSAIESRLVYHRTIQEAISALDRASSLPTPSLKERVLQLSIGGDTESMMVGRFIPCSGGSDKPDIKLRCACGYVADGCLPDKDQCLAVGASRNCR